MPGAPTDLIKEKLDIADFLRGYLTLNPAGKNFKALCPFHKEKTPSFMVSPERQSWHCFGCGIGGDAFAFLMRYENLEFGEALRVLAEKTGVELRGAGASAERVTGVLYDANREATKFFAQELERAEPPRAYLASRKLKSETSKEFEVGWAPMGEDALNLHLLQKGFAPEEIVRAGLGIKTERGLQIDRFRGRVMFPIHNAFGKVVGFTGRLLPQFDTGQTGKYVNSPETPIFNKAKLLYGFWRTKDAIREKGEAFLVEGQMDMLMSYQAGVPNVVATSGTAFGMEHIKALRRVAEKLVLSFDTDEAGLVAGERVIDLAEANDFNVRVVPLQEFKDPAEAAEKDPAGLLRMVQEAVPAQEFYLTRYLPEGMKTLRASREYLRSIRTVLGKFTTIASPVRRSAWMKELARRTGIGEDVLLEEAGRFSVTEARTAPEDAKPERQAWSRRELLSQCLLAAAAAKKDFASIASYAPYLSVEYRPLYEALAAGKHTISDTRLDALMNLVLLRAGLAEGEDMQALKHFLAEEYMKDRRAELATAVKMAEAGGNDAVLREALTNLNSHFQNEKENQEV